MRLPRVRLTVRRTIAMCWLLVPTLFAQDTKAETSRAQFEKLSEAYKAALTAWSDEFERFNLKETTASESDLERRFLAWPGWSFAPRFLKLAEDNAKDTVAVDALLQVVTDIGIRVSPNDRELIRSYKRALELLVRDHLGDERLALVCKCLARFNSRPAEMFLRTVLKESSSRNVRGVACLALAEYIVAKRDLVLNPWFSDDNKSSWRTFRVKRLDPDFFRYIRESDPEELKKKAEGLFERAARDYTDVTYGPRRKPDGRETIGEAAEMKLNDLRRSVGEVAPEIEGEDIEGAPLKLSDLRGKVVLLSFWGSWCPPCMSLIPHERSLVERLAGKNFVMLGVNSDEDRGKARMVAQREKMVWRSWWDGSPPGPIATRWGRPRVANALRNRHTGRHMLQVRSI
jgi:hypothetical protein